MKIAYFINQYPKVSHSFIRREILALERQGFEIQRIALRGWDEIVPDAADAAEQLKTRYVLRQGIAGLILPLLHALFWSPMRLCSGLLLALKLAAKSDRKVFHHVICVVEACRVVLWLKGYGAQHVHAHFGTNSAEVAMFAQLIGGVPYSFTAHGPDEFASPMALDEKVARSAFVVAISSFCRSQLYLRSRYADWPRIRVVHCGIEESYRDDGNADALRSKRLICVGRLCEAKGQLLLVEAAARLRAKGVAFELILAGDGAMRTEMERSIAKFHLGEFVRITGWISGNQVQREILASRALVLPSFAEGLPVVIMEAMALRRAVLTTYVGGIPELVTHHENGWLIPAGSVDELVSAMEDCLSRTPEDLRRMGDAAHRRVLERHSIDIETRKLSESFNSAQSAP